MDKIHKYPRTRHILGSGLQSGDEDLDRVPFETLRGRHVVAEEKLDGGNSGFSFDAGGRIHGQSRGHYLDMDARGGRERQFNLFKDWLSAHEDLFLERFEDRYTVYGEWTFAAHTVFYDRLPHFFHEFDIYDRVEDEWLDTARRRELTDGLPIVSVPVLWEGQARDLGHLQTLLGPSLYKSPDWRKALQDAISRERLDPARTTALFEDSDLAEGLYVKVEENGRVLERLKWVRPGFVQSLVDADSHWQSRPIVPNALVPGVDIFVPDAVLAWKARPLTERCLVPSP